MKTDIVYNQNKLLVNMEGNVNKKELEKLSKRIDYIVNEYGINDVILDTKNIIDGDYKLMNHLIDYLDVDITLKR